MILHDCTPAPSPRRVRIFIAEKALEIPTRPVDLHAGEQLRPEFRAKNPWCTVPVLELDDGTCLVESLAICHYLESLHPGPPLMGRDARERAQVLQWNSRVEHEGLQAVAEAWRNHSTAFRGRALPGVHDFEQLPELAARGRRRAEAFFETLDLHLATTPYVVGSHFSLADITALVTVDFAARIKLDITGRRHLSRWHRSVSSRPSASA